MATPFCTLVDVDNQGFPAAIFGVLTTAQKQACVDAANADAGSRLAGRYPGINGGGAGWSWDESVTYHTVSIACKYIIDRRGYNPSTASADKTIEDRFKRAEAFFESVQKQAVHPYITGGESAGATSQGPVIVSKSTTHTNSGVYGTNRGI